MLYNINKVYRNYSIHSPRTKIYDFTPRRVLEYGILVYFTTTFLPFVT